MPAPAEDPGTKRLEKPAPTSPLDTAQVRLPGGDGQQAPPIDGIAGEDATSAPPPEAPPRLAEGVELLGRYEDSGYREPPFMARRSDGQMVQLPALLYLIAEHADGTRTHEQIARDVSESFGRGLEAEDVQMLVNQKLRPLGLMTLPDGCSPRLQKANPLLALRLRVALIPATVTNAVAALFRPLFFPPVILTVLGGVAVVDAWLFFVHGFAQGVRHLVYAPLLLLLVFGLVVVAGVLHEIGHATACRYGGARPGVMGAGIYVVWPAFYTDVSDAYRLTKRGRLRTDLGGVYLNGIFILLTAAAYFLTGYEVLLVVIFVQHMEIVRQLLPLLRFDGYLVLSDLTGVPDLFSRMGPILVSLIPGKKPDHRVVALKPWVRMAVTVWVLVVVPVLGFYVLMALLYAPRIFATGWDSFWLQLHRTTGAFGTGNAVAGSAGILQMLALVLPAIGLVYGLGRVSTGTGRKIWTATAGRPAMRALGLTALVASLGAVGFVWWPDGDYKPMQPGERWTVPEAVGAAGATVRGEPAFEDVPAEWSEATETTAPAAEEEPVIEEPTPTVSPIVSPAESPSPSPTVTPSPSPSPTTSP
jgi:putative peptide zinc metalloprotease protein